MAFVQRGGGRVLARLMWGVSAEPPSSLAAQTRFAIPQSVWGMSAVRHMAGADETPTRGPSSLPGQWPAGSQPPPPGTPASRSLDPPPPHPAPAPSTAKPPAPGPSSAADPGAPRTPASAAAPPPPGTPSTSRSPGLSPASSKPAEASAGSSETAAKHDPASSSTSSSSSPSSSPADRRAAASAASRGSGGGGGDGNPPDGGPKGPDPKPGPARSSEPDGKGRGDGNEAEDEEGEGAPDNVHAYHRFWRDERVRQMQPMIEEGMRLNAFEGLQGHGGFLRGPDRAWSFLYDNPAARLTGAAFAPVWSAGVSLLWPLVATLTDGMIRDEVDHSFTAGEFADSVAQAVPVFYEAVAASDSEALARMCTPRAVEAVERDRRRLREEYGLEVTAVTATVRQATLAGGNLWGPESVRAFDPAWAASLQPHLSKSWLVAAAYLDVRMEVSYRRVGGGADGEGGAGWGGLGGSAGGERAEEFTLPVRRWGTWLLARGPLPKGPAESLDCPWKLVAWY